MPPKGSKRKAKADPKDDAGNPVNQPTLLLPSTTLTPTVSLGKRVRKAVVYVDVDSTPETKLPKLAAAKRIKKLATSTEEASNVDVIPIKRKKMKIDPPHLLKNVVESVETSIPVERVKKVTAKRGKKPVENDLEKVKKPSKKLKLDIDTKSDIHISTNEILEDAPKATSKKTTPKKRGKSSKAIKNGSTSVDEIIENSATIGTTNIKPQKKKTNTKLAKPKSVNNSVDENSTIPTMIEEVMEETAKTRKSPKKRLALKKNSPKEKGNEIKDPIDLKNNEEAISVVPIKPTAGSRKMLKKKDGNKKEVAESKDAEAVVKSEAPKAVPIKPTAGSRKMLTENKGNINMENLQLSSNDANSIPESGQKEVVKSPKNTVAVTKKKGDNKIEVVEPNNTETVVRIKAPKAGKKAVAKRKALTQNEDITDADPSHLEKRSANDLVAISSSALPQDVVNQTFEIGEKPCKLKITSWNVAGLRALVKKNGLDFLEQHKPDIFCMQEIKCLSDEVPVEAKIKGYHYYWNSVPGGHAGVALYTKVMPYNVDYGLGDEESDGEGRIITAEFSKFFLICVYVPNSGRKLVTLPKRLRWNTLFMEHLANLNSKKPVIVCGDMNVSHLEIDLANPKANKRNAGFTDEERNDMTKLLAGGFVDTFRMLYPEQQHAYTFWTYMGNARARNIGWRLDYFIVSERIQSKVVDNVIQSKVMGSDHCPITLFLNI